MSCKCEVEVLDGFSAIDADCPNHEPQPNLVVGTPVVGNPKVIEVETEFDSETGDTTTTTIYDDGSITSYTKFGSISLE